ncbi:LPS export ABC transporter periplasmic protein LptC [Thalassococcus sp. CAU 1522]|uniref:LPS export ABC transporter periplasmic protein LptC n=1 Tax=Thalassococcus arenae TaxID=2851652 RepID=A0ABS6N6I3_9RHOB|nr:LPS export ABC transporter periplasmic protein LptC [Thalassococcus arenae]MBV2359618.1 LPS export ABC transporter periplasmic protein LptC [Thalassococcus arenae]
MARAEGAYSSFIAWLKILLPIAALALLSTIFLFSRSTEPVFNVPFASQLELGETAQEQVRAPYFAGTTQRGDVVTMTAESARPVDARTIEADALSARMVLADGSTIDLRADKATLRNDSQNIRLQGGVEVVSSTGYVIATETLVTAIDRIHGESEGPVTATGPAGTLEAGRMVITAEDGDADVHLLFTEGVKLVYDPQDQE